MSFQDHFSGHAGAYHEARPTYPDALYDWLAAQARVRDLVWDAGCGNGQASVALARRFARVHATDPSAAQIANAEMHSNIDYRVEPAEQCSLASASADLVTVAQALHWFDFARFFAEVERVLPVNGRTGYSPDEQAQLSGGARGQLGQGEAGRSLNTREGTRERAK